MKILKVSILLELFNLKLVLPNKEIKEKLLQNLKNIEDEDNLKG